MRLLLHAITSPETAADAHTGLRGQALVRVDDSGLVAWATVLDDTGGPFSRRDLLEHHEIVSRLHAQVEACLPARFPTWLADNTVGERRDELLSALERVRGRCEVAVTAVWNAPEEESAPADDSPPGVSFLRARQRYFAGSDRRRERAGELAAEIERSVGSSLVEVRARVCPSAVVGLSMALLLPRSEAADVIARVPCAQRDVRILVNGPWPPYTFAGAGEVREV
jgi:hypothetical protein